ncbi:MAG: M12 family metallo-peptidase [Acidobacteriota bacterium]
MTESRRWISGWALLLAGLLFTLLATTSLAGAAIPQERDFQSLWASTGEASADRSAGILRRRGVQIEPQWLLPEASDGSGGPPALARADRLTLDLFAGERLEVRRVRVIPNRSGSVSWVGEVKGQGGKPRGDVILVARESTVVGSVRVDHRLIELRVIGQDADGRSLHAIQEVDESHPAYRESPPTAVPRESLDSAVGGAGTRSSEAGIAGTGGPDVFFHDLLVVYTPNARDGAGGTVAVESLVELGVTETNLSYERSGITHRVFLAHLQEIDYDETQGGGDLRDRLQDPNDGHMDEVHPLRDLHGADTVKLIFDTGGCGRAFIMTDVTPGFEAFAFCVTSQRCISPGYTFQHELGHLQGGRHQWGGDDTDNSPFTFNHGHLDIVNEFRTIMATNDNRCSTCTRRLYWANPEVNDPITGAPMGIPEGQPLATDNRKTLNATGPTTAGFRQSVYQIFANGFETGGLGGWDVVPSSVTDPAVGVAGPSDHSIQPAGEE